MSTALSPSRGLELWGGLECTVNRVGDRWFDQLVWTGHDARPDDLGRLASLGLRTLRYPVLWERLAPHRPDEIDWRFTDERLAALRHLGIRPVVGLVHHGSGPRYTSLLDDGFATGLSRFAECVARRYPWLTDFTPVNEPLTTARFSGLYGHWYPHRRSDEAFVRMLLNQVRGVILAMRAIREVIPKARLVQTEDCGRTFGVGAARSQVVHESHRRWLTWDLLTGRVQQGHPLYGYLKRAGMTEADEALLRESDIRPDVLGLNYYLTSDRYLDDRLERYPPETHGGNGTVAYVDVDAVRGRPAGIAGHEAHLVNAWRRYRIPVAITEAHLGCTREEQMRWMVESWEGALAARARGADVRAVTAWALLGSYNWDSLVTRDADHYEAGAFDVRGRTPHRTALASLISALADGQSPDHPALRGTPWWRRHQESKRTATVSSTDRPLLIVGATGTLGRAFQRICRSRGLAAIAMSRHELDISDPRRVEALLAQVRPWAVVNAAGYVRVDEAERDVLGCNRANLAGPVNLAGACRRCGIALATFSSDLVFDGLSDRAYVENDAPAPLNRYGAAKAEAERLVLEILPRSLVIRTSAFFGPWDDAHFLAGLFRALDQRTEFLAPADSVVSPTYVPDLVNASLDLLIDQATGLWHLANDGAATWFDFARAAARESGRNLNLILPAETARVWGPASRPRFSALSSVRGRLMRPLDAAIGAFLNEDADLLRTA